MSFGYTGMCRKEFEDDKLVIYSYSGENWNDCGKSKSGDSLLYDGVFIIHKRCLEEPEIHTKLKRFPSGRKKLVEKRILHCPDIYKHIADRKIIIEKVCKNAFKIHSETLIDYIAYMLLIHVFEKYQENGFLVETGSFIQ